MAKKSIKTKTGKKITTAKPAASQRKKADTRNKRNEAQKLEDMVLIEILTHRGNNQTEIANAINEKRAKEEKPYKLSQQQVSYDMAALKEMWKTSAIIDIDTEKGRVKSHLELLMKEAHSAWLRSQEDAVVHTEGFGPLGSTSQTRTEGQVGDARFIGEIRAILKQYADLFGIEAPKRSELTGKNGKELIPKEADDTRREILSKLVSIAAATGADSVPE